MRVVRGNAHAANVAAYVRRVGMVFIAFAMKRTKFYYVKSFQMYLRWGGYDITNEGLKGAGEG